MPKKPKEIHVHDIDTFDSGLGGVFTAHAIREFIKKSLAEDGTNIVKELAQRGHFFRVSHYGDTQNAPYGDRTPTEIGELTSRAVLYSLEHKAELVFIACNTASTQASYVRDIILEAYPQEQEKVDKVIPIIDKSAEALAQKLIAAFSEDKEQTLSSGFLATKATVNSRAYPNALLEKLRVLLPDADVEINNGEVKNEDADGYSHATSTLTINLPDGRKKTIHLNQYSPQKWVGLIEAGKNADGQVKQDIAKYVELFPEDQYPNSTSLGLFCTHYPALQNNIRIAFSELGQSPELITQAGLMRQVFENFLNEKCQPLLNDEIIHKSDAAIRKRYTEGNPPLSEIVYHITGPNIEETQRTLQTLFGREGGGQGNTGITVKRFQYTEAPGFADTQVGKLADTATEEKRSASKAV